MAVASVLRDDGSPWAPLRIPIYRAFWLASLASNFGSWIHEIGAGWLMTSLDANPEMVASVRTFMALPIVCLAIPAGVLADRVDRRRLLLLTQFALFLTTGVLALLTLAEQITPEMLLALTFLVGLGMVLHVPTWQASVPELVPRRQIARAVSLGSVNFNLARALGPAIGGLLIAAVGVWSAFAINAFSFLGVILVISQWRRSSTESSRGVSFARSMRQGIFYVTLKRDLRHVLIGVVLFVLPASSFWGLVPLLTRAELGWGPDGFGMLVGMIGLGAIAAAWFLPAAHHRLGPGGTIALAMTAFAIGLGVISQVRHPAMIIASTIVMGAGWMMTLTTLNATAQINLPRPLRARGMGCYLTAMAASMSIGSFVWGQIAGATSVTTAMTIASGLLLVHAGLSRVFKVEGRKPNKFASLPPRIEGSAIKLVASSDRR